MVVCGGSGWSPIATHDRRQVATSDITDSYGLRDGLLRFTDRIDSRI